MWRLAGMQEEDIRRRMYRQEHGLLVPPPAVTAPLLRHASSSSGLYHCHSHSRTSSCLWCAVVIRLVMLDPKALKYWALK